MLGEEDMRKLVLNVGTGPLPMLETQTQPLVVLVLSNFHEQYAGSEEYHDKFRAVHAKI